MAKLFSTDLLWGDSTMTLPRERTLSILNTRQFLIDLMDKEVTPRVPFEIRLQARQLLKHYPDFTYLEDSAKALPDIWGPLAWEDK